MNERFQMMLNWLDTLPLLQGCDVTHPDPASADASFRRYFRIQAQCATGSQSYIIMDAQVSGRGKQELFISFGMLICKNSITKAPLQR